MRRVKERLRHELTKAFLTEFSTMLDNFRLEPISDDRVYDPVTETYTGTPTTPEEFLGLKRQFNRTLVDEIHIKNTDIKVTCIQGTHLTTTPKVNDVVVEIKSDLSETKYRVLAVFEDAADLFYTMQLRGVTDG